MIQQLKFVYQEACNSSSDTITSSTKAITALYAIFHVIAKHSKPFTDDEFVKECLIATVQSFRDSLTLEEAASILLSANAVKSRINCIASSLQEKLKSLLESCSFFYASMKVPIIDM